MKLESLIIIIFLSLITVRPAVTSAWDVPPLDMPERGTIKAYDKDGEFRWTADWTTESFTENGKKMLNLTLTGSGLISPFTEKRTWKSVSVWNADESFYPVRSETVIKNTSGKTVMIDKKTVDTSLGTVLFQRKDLTGDTSQIEIFDLTDNTIIMEGMVIALRDLPFGEGSSARAKFITNEPAEYDMEFKQMGIETVPTPGGDIQCYKVEFVPKLGLLSVFKAFFPKTYMWFTVDEPHRWVKYEGLENGRDSPEVVMNVVDFEDASDN